MCHPRPGSDVGRRPHAAWSAKLRAAPFWAAAYGTTIASPPRPRKRADNPRHPALQTIAFPRFQTIASTFATKMRRRSNSSSSHRRS